MQKEDPNRSGVQYQVLLVYYTNSRQTVNKTISWRSGPHVIHQTRHFPPVTTHSAVYIRCELDV